ncbi:MAG: hypothetical protein IGNPGNKH_00041 [Sodalis sp. Ffu]|nr:MAG: hypothetical protein IGNPGNKH_00041 [Sodalis sp. Ffu]
MTKPALYLKLNAFKDAGLTLRHSILISNIYNKITRNYHPGPMQIRAFKPLLLSDNDTITGYRGGKQTKLALQS